MKKNDYIAIIILLSITLCLTSLIFVYSSSSIKALYLYNNDVYYLKRQFIFYTVGFIAMILVSYLNYTKIEKYSGLIFFISFILSILVLIPGIGIKVNGARRWLKLGFINLTVSEITKISLIISIATFLEKSKNKRNMKILVPSIIIILIHVLPIAIEDLGSGFQIFITAITMIYLSNIDYIYFLNIFLVSLATLGIFIVSTSRIKRISYFLMSFSKNYNHQLKQSLVGIGKGGILGCKIGNSVQKYNYLPEAHTDFIFSIISEEGGLVLSIFIVICYLLLLFIGIKISLNSNNTFGAYLSLGLTISIIYQVLINISVTIGLIPSTGIPLPFISHGGSGIVMNMIFIGLILSVTKRSIK